jgi:hypothetical protein
MIDAGFEILNQRGTPMFFSDTFANRPAAGIVGRIFISTDTNEIYRDTGTGWNLLGGGGGTIGGTIATGQIAYGTAADTIGGSNNLFWNSGTNTQAITGNQTISGKVGIGTSIANDRILTIAKDLTGTTTSYGIIQFNTIKSDVTTAATNNYSQLATEAAAFTITDAFHYYCADTTKGLGSTITNQYGYFASAIVNGNNNFGFYSNLDFAVGRWNFYANNNALNYLRGSLLLNTTTSTGEQLQVNGTSSFLGNITLGLNQNAATGFTITNTTSGTAANSFLKLQTTNASTYGEFAKLSALYTTYKIFVGNDLAIYNTNTSGDIAILNDFGTGNIKFAAGGSSTAQMTLHNTGNLLIGSTSNTGERLQVTGTSKITGASSFGGNMTLSLNHNAATLLTVSNTTNGTNSLATIQAISNSNGTVEVGKFSQLKTANKIIASGDGYLYNNIYGDIAILNDVASGNIKFAAGGSSTAQMTLQNTGNLLLNSLTDTGEKLQVTGTSKITGASSFGGNMTLSFNQNAATLFTINNTTSGTSSQSGIIFNSNLSGTGGIGKYSSTTNAFKTITATDFYLYNGNNGDISILNDFPTGNIKFAAGASSTAQMTLHNSGNLLLGSTTNTGERLQITGTQLNTDTRTYSTGSINSLVVSKNLTIPSGATIPSGGQSITSINASGTITFQGSLTIPNNAVFSNSAAISIYSIPNTATTITSTQATGTRTIAQNIVQNQFSGTNSATFTHVSSTQILGYYNNNTGSITPIIDNAYQLFINSISDYGHTFTFTNRWGIYQEGTNDRNYLAGNLLVGSNIDGGEKLQITGTAIIYSKLSMGAGTTSNAQINLASSTAPTSPNNGDIWFDGTNLFMRIGGVTKTFTII